MLEEENIILKNLGSIDKKMDGLAVKFDNKLDRLEKRMDGRMLPIAGKMDLVARQVDERTDLFEKRMDGLEESNRKVGMLLEKLDSKFDFALEGYSSSRH